MQGANTRKAVFFFSGSSRALSVVAKIDTYHRIAKLPRPPIGGILHVSLGVVTVLRCHWVPHRTRGSRWSHRVEWWCLSSQIPAVLWLMPFLVTVSPAPS